MKAVEQTRRELFEAWYSTQPSYTEGDALQMRDGQYWYIGTRKAWSGFNAALDAVEIELPKLSDQPVEDHYNWSACELKCRAAIESTNLGIKVK